MRPRLVSLLLLAACTPAPPASQPAADPAAAQSERGAASTAQNTQSGAGSASASSDASATASASVEAPLTWADVAREPALIGHWRANADETRADFGGDAAPSTFSFGCDRGFVEFTRTFSRPHGVALGTNTPFNILLPNETIRASAAPASNDPQRLWAAASRRDFRLDTFVASADGFAVQTAGDAARFRQDPLLARVLANCRH